MQRNRRVDRKSRAFNSPYESPKQLSIEGFETPFARQTFIFNTFLAIRVSQQKNRLTPLCLSISAMLSAMIVSTPSTKSSGQTVALSQARPGYPPPLIVPVLNRVRLAGTVLLCRIVKMTKSLTAILYEFNSTRINYWETDRFLYANRGKIDGLRSGIYQQTLSKRIAGRLVLAVKDYHKLFFRRRICNSVSNFKNQYRFMYGASIGEGSII
jgi:hypothetical protein